MLVDAHTIRLGISFDRPAITSGRKTVVVGEVSVMVLIMVISVMDNGCQIARSLDMIEGRRCGNSPERKMRMTMSAQSK